MLGVLFFSLTNSGSNFYRIEQPAFKLDQQGLCDVGVVRPGDSEEKKLAAMRTADVMVFYSATSLRMAEQFEAFQKNGTKIVMDMNDDIFNVSPFSPHYKYLGKEEFSFVDEEGTVVKLWQDGVDGFDPETNRERLEQQKEVLRAVDLITVTTPYLAELFGEFNKTAVLPDMVNLQWWKNIRVRYPEPFIRLGWRGGYSHYEDLMSVKPAIERVMAKGKNTKLVLTGWGSKEFLKSMPQDRIETYEFLNHPAYPYHMMSLGINVAFYPWKDIRFNKGKNNICWIEWSALEVPGVYPALSPYSEMVHHNETGLLALSNEGWIESIQKLLKDHFFARKIAKNARAEVEKKWDINKHIWKWKGVYESLWESTKLPDRAVQQEAPSMVLH